ncbi:MAG: hypothetical protein GF364_20050 [Candidatus Lokiarchaeota archaeon]|nr:hypothetical protein [Candidatus Lokiarchaeota archaeon]
MAIDFSTWDFSWIYWSGFEIIAIIYFIAFGSINLYYAFKSKNNPQKKDVPKFFVNEVATAVLWFFIAAIYPFIWDTVTSNPWVKAQLYFHMWDTFTIQLIGWPIHLYFAHRNNLRKNREISYEDWKVIQIEKYNSMDPTSLKSDIKRKLQHLLPGLVVVGFYYLALTFEDILLEINWNVMTGTMYFTAAVGITFALLMNIFDLVRLMKWDLLGKFARSWANGALHPDELLTVTTAAPMVLAFVPFFILPQKQFLFAVCLISGISDALACIVGKKWGKKRSETSQKTREGYIAGMVSAYLLAMLVNVIYPFSEVGWGIVNIMAIVAAIGFFCVDYFAKYLSDNILNSLACGFGMYIVYLIAVSV